MEVIERNNIALTIGDDEDEGEIVDAQATLAQALVNAATPISTYTIRAAAFLSLYLGDAASRPLIKMAFKYKPQQSHSAIKDIVKGIEGMAIVNKAKYMDLIGGGGGKK